jgi:adenylate cyclase
MSKLIDRQKTKTPGNKIAKATSRRRFLSSEANGGQILTDQKTLSKVEHLVEAEPLGDLQLKGFGRPTAVFNIVRLKL